MRADNVPAMVNLSSISVRSRICVALRAGIYPARLCRISWSELWYEWCAACGKSWSVNSAALLNKNMMSSEAGDEQGVTEETLLGTRSLASAVGHEVPKFKIGYVSLLKFLSGEVWSRRSECEAITRKSADRDTKVAELDLKVRFLAIENGKVGHLQNAWTPRSVRLSRESRCLRRRKIPWRQWYTGKFV